jgi:glucosamine--fructose-6-phosphate aminotransferase (isomerizing)
MALLTTSRMLEEIFEQPAALERTLRTAVSGVAGLRKILRAKSPSLVMIVARGTSDNAAQFGRYLIEITTGIPVSLGAASVFTLYGSAMRLKDALVVGISQSGESTDTNAVLGNARENGAITVGLTNEAGSAMAGIAEYPILLDAGRETSVAATKTYTCELLAMYLIAWALGASFEIEDLGSIPAMVESALTVSAATQEKARRYAGLTRAMTVGRGLNYANALEFGLKLMETCYVSTDRFSSADLMHGPIALIEADFPVFLFAPGGPTQPSMLALLDRLRGLKAETLTITDDTTGIADGPDSIVLPLRYAATSPADLYTAIPYIVPGQLFAAHLAVVKGLDPDSPRTLSKITRTM